MRALPGLVLVLATAAIPACGGASADRPLTVPVGLTRDGLVTELRAHEYCPGKDRPSEREVFERCDVPGVEFGQSWVVAYFVDGRVIRLQRYERYADDARTQERFNQLVEKRSVDGPPSDEARALLARRDLPVGTRTWVAFRAGETTLAGVFLLTPTPPENATILEEIIRVE